MMKQPVLIRRHGQVHLVRQPLASKRHPRKVAHLLKLPRELRYGIYDYLNFEKRSVINLRRIPRLPVLAPVCRQLFDEVSLAYFAKNRLSLQISLSEAPFAASGYDAVMKPKCKDSDASFAEEDIAVGAMQWLRLVWRSARVRYLTLKIDFGPIINLGVEISVTDKAERAKSSTGIVGIGTFGFKTVVLRFSDNQYNGLYYSLRPGVEGLSEQEWQRLAVIGRVVDDIASETSHGEEWSGFTLLDIERITAAIEKTNAQCNVTLGLSGSESQQSDYQSRGFPQPSEDSQVPQTTVRRSLPGDRS